MNHSSLNRQKPLASRRPRHTSGFSLVEVTLAIGIIAFAFVALFALLPSGLTTFRQAMDTSVGAQIVQRIVSDAQETDFQTLLDSAVEKNKGTGSQYYRLPLRYFDDQGSEVPVKSAETPDAAEQVKIIYVVRVRGSNPGKPKPSEHTSSYFTSLPSVTGTRFNPREVTILTAQIARNPSNRPLAPLVDSGTFLISSALADKANIPLQTYSVAVARNKFTPKPL